MSLNHQFHEIHSHDLYSAFEAWMRMSLKMLQNQMKLTKKNLRGYFPVDKNFQYYFRSIQLRQKLDYDDERDIQSSCSQLVSSFWHDIHKEKMTADTITDILSFNTIKNDYLKNRIYRHRC